MTAPFGTAAQVFVVIFGLVTILGFVAARWRRGDLSQLHEWGLGGRRFGTLVTWFLLGGDMYTAYTFIAVPAVLFGAGAMGFFAIPYTVFIFPIMLLVFPRFWTVAKNRGHVTAADFVRDRFGSRTLALAVALTGIMATMPYIALQLVGLQVVFGALGVRGEWPLIIAFSVLAAFTYTSGLRGPAMVAIVKDLLIYLTIIAALIIIPERLGGYGEIFSKIDPSKLLLAPPSEANVGQQAGYITLVVGSTFAIFLYPHVFTGILSSSSGHVIRKNALFLPAYSAVLGFIALLGFMAVAAGLGSDPAFAAGFSDFGANFAVPALFLKMFPEWFVGLAFAAIAVGALVPAGVMSIAAANLFTRNIYREYFDPQCTAARETHIAKLVSLFVKLGALLFVLFLPTQYAIEFQLLGGIWIIQTLPSVLLGLYTRWLHPFALLIGWAIGMGTGTAMAAASGFKVSIYPLHILGWTIPCYAALSSLVVNLLVSFVLSWLLNAALRNHPRIDGTCAADYC